MSGGPFEGCRVWRLSIVEVEGVVEECEESFICSEKRIYRVLVIQKFRYDVDEFGRKV
jgi:hypothetical protein